MDKIKQLKSIWEKVNSLRLDVICSFDHECIEPDLCEVELKLESIMEKIENG